MLFMLKLGSKIKSRGTMSSLDMWFHCLMKRTEEKEAPDAEEAEEGAYLWDTGRGTLRKHNLSRKTNCVPVELEMEQ